MMNYKQLLTYWNSISYHHEQIRSFGYGDLTQCTNDIETKQEPLYPRVYLVPDMVELSQNRIYYNFSVIVMDKIEDDMSNLTDVMSDTLAIVQDLWTVFWQSYTDQYGNFSKIVVGDWSPDVVPFQERFQTTLGGWTMNIKMSAPFDYNTCDIPITPGFEFGQDESYSSYKQILQDWKDFSENHFQIRSYGFGDEHQLTNDIETKQEPLYPRIYFVPDITKLEESHMHITWKVIVSDKIEDDLSNQVDVMSDTLEIIKDFFSKNYLSDYDAEFNCTVEPWLEKTQTILGGWTLTISIQQKFDYNRCVLPILDFGGLTWEQVQQLWKDVTDKWKNV